jgi:thioesterase DpgC
MDDPVEAWSRTKLRLTGEFERDAGLCADYWRRSSELIQGLPRKPEPGTAAAVLVSAIPIHARALRERFLALHVEAVYEVLTVGFTRFIRVEDLVFAAAECFPGLTPSRAELAEEAGLDQKDKDGREIDQGILIAHILAHERAGRHLCHAMLMPRPESSEALARLQRDGHVDLGPARLDRRGKAVHLTASNPRYLNAEDQSTLAAMETAVDAAILDGASEIAVLRGGTVEHPKYRGRRIFGAGINLTHLYRGKIPFLWYLERDLGFVHKLFRGVARAEALPDDTHGAGIEKPWIAAVDGFAIGGHCQILLAVDYVLAADDAYMTLPARKEGIIPGAANLRLPRFTGERLARQLIQYERRLDCASPEGRLICDEIAPAGEMDGAIDRTVAGLTSAGAVSAVGNRRAFRVGLEPLDLFRRYFAVYAREQAHCHFSPALIANLERNWDAKNRKG